jgi:nucleoside-diphosphate-sugar epimerase
MKNVLITGASGFVGTHLKTVLANQGYNVISCSRKYTQDANWRPYPSSEYDQWEDILDGVDVVVHLAGIAHNSRVVREDFETANLLEVKRLVTAAKKSKVEHLIFASTIAVFGESASDPLRESDVPNPKTDYAKTKLAAERALKDELEESHVKYTILRPPMIYGPNAKGNFKKLAEVVSNGTPMPLSLVKNRRTFLGIQNFCDFISSIILNEKSYNQIFHVAEEPSISTADLIREIGKARGRKAILFPVPTGVLRFGLSLAGKGEMASKLLDDFEVDGSKARSVLGWEAPYSLQDGLKDCFS